MKKNLIIMALSMGLFVSCDTNNHYNSFEEYPVYSGEDLELIYSAQSSKFRVWAPTADEVRILLYDNGEQGGAYKTVEMKKSDDGTWAKEISENLKGKFYTFQVKIGERWLDETPGMWVKAVGLNGKRAAIIDLSETNPDGWDLDERPALKNYNDIMIYEVHVRDFSVSPNSGMKNKGKFLAFTEHGTKNSFGESTGIDHLKELGVTHVHLLPSFDFASIDESKLQDNKYNWGYDPLNYNVPEGSYSTNPADPKCRIKEFKQMVQSLHKSGIRVIMDVVYNHTFIGPKSHLDLLAPGYFYRMNSDSSWSNASGCNNETASERPMMRKFMIESVVYWATEYHVDGFRFDLMGIHDIETMNEIRAALDKIDPSIFMYGEGWTAGASPLAEDKRALKKNAKQLDRIAVFSDDIRDALKGSWMHSEIPGFVSGTDSLEESVKFGIVGGVKFDSINYTKTIYSKEPYVNEPYQSINYVSCHDDMCLVDKLRESKPAGTSDEDIIRFNKLAQTVVFTSQGIPFLYAGEELFRDKKGIHNTYQSPDSVNQINWDNKNKYQDVFLYYKGLIELRKNHNAFRISSSELIRSNLEFIKTGSPNLIAYILKNHVNGEKWKDILVILNGNRHIVSVPIPIANWTVICHDGKINQKGISTTSSAYFSVPASSASILYSE